MLLVCSVDRTLPFTTAGCGSSVNWASIFQSQLLTEPRCGWSGEFEIPRPFPVMCLPMWVTLQFVINSLLLEEKQLETAVEMTDNAPCSSRANSVCVGVLVFLCETVPAE